jgi:hypothetical protein
LPSRAIIWVIAPLDEFFISYADTLKYVSGLMTRQTPYRVFVPR